MTEATAVAGEAVVDKSLADRFLLELLLLLRLGVLNTRAGGATEGDGTR